ncbi:MAG: hypothetical protein JOZ49_04490 [Mycolicibacterium sp.]|nr:hypothetical protein [Mycolicibacterium sp.]
MSAREEVRKLLLESINNYASEQNLNLPLDNNTPLLGRGAVLDSLGLVNILVDFEAALNDRFNTELVLASEKAMAMERSPFRSVGRLVEYADSLLKEVGKA